MSDVCFRPLIEAMTWSYSRLKSFTDCPYQWYLKYIHGSDEVPQFYASYGKFIHKIIEKYYRGELPKEDMRMYFLTNFSTEVEGFRPSPKIVENYVAKGLNFIDNFTEFPYECVDVEKKIYFEVDGIKFVAILDFIGKDKDGNFVIIDNKSRELKPRGKKKRTKNDDEIDEMLTQLYLYSAAILSEYGKLPTKLCFNCFKNGVFIEEDFDETKYKEAIEWAKKTVEEISSVEEEDFRPDIEFFRCCYLCGFSDDCLYWQNRGR